MNGSDLKIPGKCQLPSRLTDDVLDQFANPRFEYPEFYDELFESVGKSIRDQGYLTKRDISALAAWKRLNLSVMWMDSLQRIPDDELEGLTNGLFSGTLATSDLIAAVWGSGIPGFSSGTFAVASTMLSAWNPREFAITDRRSRESLAGLRCGCERTLNKYSVYLAHVHAIRDATFKNENSPLASSRHIDKVLFMGLEVRVSTD